MELDGDLFSGLEEAQEPQPEERPYDKIIETRKNTTFASEQIERQEEVQVVDKTEPKIEYRSYPGHHEWDVWRFSMHHFVQRLFR